MNELLIDSAPAAAAYGTIPRMRPPSPAEAADARYFLLDLDGTLIRQNVVVDDAARLIECLQDRYVVVSNNSTHTAAGLARVLRRMGLAIPAARLVLAGEHTLQWLAERHAQARLRLVASAALRHAARRLGCRLVDSRPDIVVLARDVRFGYATLATIANELREGARLVVTNPDASHPARDGGVVPETGSLMRAVVACAAVEAETVIGKPEGVLFREALRRLGAEAAETLMIGDNPATDGLGAARIGMRCLLVGSAEVPSLGAVVEALAEKSGYSLALTPALSQRERE